MSETHCLGGKVTHQTLPILNDASVPDAPALKRLHLPRGDLAQVHDGAEPIHFIAWLELKAGGIRGNHVHRRKKEYLYLLDGAASLLLEDIHSRERASLELTAGDLVVIEPGIAHAIHSPVHGQALEFSPARFDPTDTSRYEVPGSQD